MLFWLEHLLYIHRISHPQFGCNWCSPYLVMNHLSPYHIVVKNHPPHPYFPHFIPWLYCALLYYRASSILLLLSVFPILVMWSSLTSTLDRSPYPELSLNFFPIFLFIDICPTFIIWPTTQSLGIIPMRCTYHRVDSRVCSSSVLFRTLLHSHVVTILFPYHSILLIIHSFHLLTWRGRGNVCFLNTTYLLVCSFSTFSLVNLSSDTFTS